MALPKDPESRAHFADAFRYMTNATAAKSRSTNDRAAQVLQEIRDMRKDFQGGTRALLDGHDSWGLKFAAEMLCPPGIRLVSVEKDPQSLVWVGKFLIERTGRTVRLDVTDVVAQVEQVRAQLLLLA